MKEQQFKTNVRCGECGAPLIFDRISNKGTAVVFSSRGQQIHRNAIMPFLWVHFKCSKGCDWQLCTTNKSKDVIHSNEKCRG